MKIILLNAPPNTGKDTIADYVVEKYGKNQVRSFLTNAF